MTNSARLLATAALFGCCSAPAAAQDQGDGFPPPDDLEPGTIIVTGERLRGQVITEQAPILELDQAEISAFGAGSIQELVQALDSQAGSTRGRGAGGRPVFLINGIRISGFREFRSYPPEAIRKVEILPEEVAQRFGFPPDRRVMNFILQDDFSSREIEAEFEMPDRGNYWRNEQEFTLLKIANGGRLNINLEVEDTSALTEGERGVIQSEEIAPGEPDPAFFRTLVADSWGAEATANWAKAFIESGSSISLNATYERDENLRLSGLDPLRDFVPLERRSATDTFSSAASHERKVGIFQLSATVDASHAMDNVRTDRRGDTVVDLARSETTSASSKAVLRGAPFQVPAGEVTTTFDVGFDWDRISSDDTRTDVPTRLTRGNLSSGVNLVVPLTSSRTGVLDTLGSFTINAQVRGEHLSDFGTLWRWSGGLTWAPFENLDLQATYTRRDAPPSLQQLGNPEIATLNVPIFDFTRGETVLATIITGGNPDLVAEAQSDWRFAANWKVPFFDGTRLSAEYIRNRSDDVTTAFPALTPAIEAAFPDRVTRDLAGTLLTIDRRPITYAETNTDRLVLGLTRRGSFGEAQPRGGPPGGEARGGSGRGPGAQRGGGRPPMRFGRDGRGRYFVNLNHTIELENEVLVAEGGPLLDLLAGDGASGFGLSRHSTTLEAGFFRNGKGVRISGRYTGPSRISAGLVPGQDELRFGSLARLDLRFFADLGRLLKQEEGVLQNLRLSLLVDNVFDERREVTDANGETPLSYQPFLVDPVGRYLGIDIRKMF